MFTSNIVEMIHLPLIITYSTLVFFKFVSQDRNQKLKVQLKSLSDWLIVLYIIEQVILVFGFFISSGLTSHSIGSSGWKQEVVGFWEAVDHEVNSPNPLVSLDKAN
jgi:hypothetical protein